MYRVLIILALALPIANCKSTQKQASQGKTLTNDAPASTPVSQQLDNAFSLTYLAELAYSDRAMIENNILELGVKVERAISIKETFYYIITSGNTAVIAFRGTEKKLRDIWTNLRFNHRSLFGGGVHCGFCKAFGAVRSDLRDTLLKLLNKGVNQFYFTGHSLGGALANIAALDTTLYLRSLGKEYNDAYLSNFQVAGLYTFGSPRVFDKKGAAILNTIVPKHYRFIFGNDLVVKLPWIIQKYRHAGKALRFNPKDCKLTTLVDMKQGFLKEKWKNFKNFWTRKGLEDHRLKNYRYCLGRHH